MENRQITEKCTHQEKLEEANLKFGADRPRRIAAALPRLLEWAAEWAHGQGQEELLLFLSLKATLLAVCTELNTLLGPGSPQVLPAS